MYQKFIMPPVSNEFISINKESSNSKRFNKANATGMESYVSNYGNNSIAMLDD